MATRPYKPLHPRQVADIPIHTLDTAEQLAISPLQHLVLYRSAKRARHAFWQGDAILHISALGTAVLRDTETDTEMARQRIASHLLPLQVGRRVYMAGMVLEIQGDTEDESDAVCVDAGAGTQRPGASSQAVRQPYKRPETHDPFAATSSSACEECKAHGLECDHERPCTACAANQTAYCSYVNSTFTVIRRTPLNPNKGGESSKSCHNCRIFGLGCHEQRPCTSCLMKHRAFCTWTDESGSVISAVCPAFVHTQDQVVPRSDYSGDPDECWPAWPPAPPKSSTLSRLKKRFQRDNECPGTVSIPLNFYHGFGSPYAGHSH